MTKEMEEYIALREIKVKKANRRDDICEDVLRGRLTPGDAERIAREEGLGPFHFCPDESSYDPEEEAYWALPMVLAWIVYRDFSKVRRHWEKYTNECKDWIPRHFRVPNPDGETYSEYQGFELCQRSPSTVELLMLHVIYNEISTEPKPLFLDGRQALTELLKQLAVGGLVCFGRAPISQQHVPIAAQEWASLNFITLNDGEDILSHGNGLSGTAYADPKFLWSEVLKIWPRDLKAKGTEALPPKQKNAFDAINDLWNGVKPPIPRGERNKKVIDWCKARGIATPSDRTIDGVFSSLIDG